MKVVLPDNAELELPDGATGLDAARAIGPKLAEQAVLVRANGDVRDLRAPLADGESIQILTTRDKQDPDALYVLRHSTAHLLAEAVRRLYPGVKIAIGPPIENGFYYDFEFPEPVHESDLERIEAEIGKRAGGRAGVVARGDLARRREGALRGGGRAVQGRARRHRRGRHHAVHAGRLHRPLPRPAPAGLEADQGGQAHRPRGRVLARRRAQHAADPDLRHRVLRPGRPRRPPRRARGGAGARPPAAGAAARPLPPLRPLARLAVLAPEGDGGLELARGPPATREPEARLRRGEDAAPLRHPDVHHLGPLRELPRGHVLRPLARRARVRAQADELPGAHAPLRQPAALSTASCRSASPSRRRCTGTSSAGRCTASCA